MAGVIIDKNNNVKKTSAQIEADGENRDATKLVAEKLKEIGAAYPEHQAPEGCFSLLKAPQLRSSYVSFNGNKTKVGSITDSNIIAFRTSTLKKQQGQETAPERSEKSELMVNGQGCNLSAETEGSNYSVYTDGKPDESGAISYNLTHETDDAHVKYVYYIDKNGKEVGWEINKTPTEDESISVVERKPLKKSK